ncbi:TIGR04219 family outer membrane beta-barrel protein [Ferrimonas marina]|uniref:Outer membrane protein n=1 Tax=Ferrimonas marina TaxID=299255 RepID=A0A1M5X5S2_9GAMM|nr:TIGR04219 family outer membrane beta-barrel protein [Ferrimonas marina]SHH95159.1 outer membrane protein [Ferrimonas marina]
MKFKPSILAVALAAPLALPAQADLLGAKAGLDLFFVNTSGSLEADSPAWDDKSRLSAYAAFEHFVPLLPNVMLRYNQMGTGKEANELDLSNTDFVFYYQLLDNSGVELDLGVNYRLYSGEVRQGGWNQEDLDNGVVMGYARTRVNLVSTGLFVFADVSISTFTSDNISDYQLGMGYGLDLPLFDLNLKAGYRQHDFDVKGFSGVTADVTQDGWFMGAELTF